LTKINTILSKQKQIFNEKHQQKRTIIDKKYKKIQKKPKINFKNSGL